MVQLIIDYYFINDIHKNKNPKNQKLIIIACKKEINKVILCKWALFEKKCKIYVHNNLLNYKNDVPYKNYLYINNILILTF